MIEQFKKANKSLTEYVNKLNGSDVKIIKCIRKFYEITKDINDINNLDLNKIDDKLKFLIELCNELINIDMCVWISTGTNPKNANKMYKFIRNL